MEALFISARQRRNSASDKLYAERGEKAMNEKETKEIRKMLEAIEGFNCGEECENCVKNGFTCLTFDVAKDLYKAGCRLNGENKGENHE